MQQLREINSFSQIITEAVGYWGKTLRFQILFSLCYFMVYLGLTYFLFDYYGILAQIQELSVYFSSHNSAAREKYLEIITSENFISVSFWMVGVMALLFPLNLGLFNIYNKMDKNEQVFTSDLFVGFEGSNFFKYFGYALLWGAIYYVCKMFFILMPVWILLTLLTGPLIFLEQKSILQALQLSFKLVINNMRKSISVFLLAIVGSYCGIFLCGIGLLLTLPFWNAVLYAYYRKLLPVTLG
ncbi:hypothetical protein GNY06_09160 [Elizabethkingia argentiflava]|uniref:Beta-carotene 15,15'-monooxygenase n=1 Tax=Elizabethkingia argenteiflava TaxID=2681556 RepID=A0A845PZN2_9FLAO|nr:hypothetical protein [Elizabethkingia argenteiflava]NAW51540.1 hypothetical protein [Elizabethkingia argenteiflava]